jgi:ABC-type branched-subunit amino acid transport system substrate-binding protein
MGVLSCFTGTLSGLGQAMLQGAQVAQKAINDAGGILGRQLNLAHADTQCDEADSIPALHQLLAAQNVVGIIGPETQEINADAPIITAAKIPDEFQGGSTLFDHNTNTWLWRDSPSDSQLGVAMALYAHKQGYKNAALLFYSDIAAQTFAAPIKATWQKLGHQIVSNITVAPDQTSYRTQVQQVINAHPDVIFTQTDAATAAVLFQNFKELNNLAIPFVGTDVTGVDQYLKAVTYAAANAHLVSVYGTSVSGQAADAFNQVFLALFGSKVQPLANANYAYDSVISLALAIDKANSTAGPAINASMTAVTNPPGTQCYTYKDCLKLLNAGTKINYEGASGDLNYNQYQNVFGPYGAFQVDLKGQEQQVMLLSAPDLAAATP